MSRQAVWNALNKDHNQLTVEQTSTIELQNKHKQEFLSNHGIKGFNTNIITLTTDDKQLPLVTDTSQCSQKTTFHRSSMWFLYNNLQFSYNCRDCATYKCLYIVAAIIPQILDLVMYYVHCRL